MANQRKTAMTRAALGAAAGIGLACILFFGTAVEHAAESAAACMESAKTIDACSRVNGGEFWARVASLAVLGFIVGGVCFIYGDTYRDRQQRQ
jgi:hypothetical protein